MIKYLKEWLIYFKDLFVYQMSKNDKKDIQQEKESNITTHWSQDDYDEASKTLQMNGIRYDWEKCKQKILTASYDSEQERESDLIDLDFHFGNRITDTNIYFARRKLDK